MLDNRKGLSSGYELVFDKKFHFVILEEIGRGASCIVYSASYIDATNLKHHVRIKECYPHHIHINRNDNGELAALPSFSEEFIEAKKEFYIAYEQNVYLKNVLGLMNSTVDSINMLSINNTWYIVMNCIEGRDYRFEIDDSLQSVFIRMKTLAGIIKKYHDAGMLYLDIKPENILIVPETKEHMVLFDFGSLLSLEDLIHKQDVKFSYSYGYSAPELVQGTRKRICTATDVYSIGAIVFYKIFGRTPTVLECSIGSEYDFSNMNFKDKKYQPELFRKLNLFLRKTLAVLGYRYKTIEEVIEIIDELIKLSDVKDTFLFDNFTYHSACFIGRVKEIGKIYEELEKHQVVFLSGIGGIGKTEIAKRFAYEFRDNYRKIIFVSFSNTIMETVCGNNLRINNFSQEESESDDDYFERKIKVLKNITGKGDLIILDNFDVESDDNLDSLLECPCKFLITTREDFRDYNYTQIEVTKMKDFQEIVTLFQAYNVGDYINEEMQSIEDIIELVDGHTMSVELIAKYLRITGESPSVLLSRMIQKEGITSVEEVGVKHRKDKKMRTESVNRHLLILFDLSMFSNSEYELIKSLALMGYIRIQKGKFLEYCNISNNVKGLESLIKRGWIEYDEDTNKISLHQVILDLVYNYLKPTSEQCPHIVISMTQYAGQRMDTYMERDVKRRVLDLFIQRVNGADINYAAFLVSYCGNIRNRIEYLQRAEELCEKFQNKESKNLLKEICLLTLEKNTNCDDIFTTEIEMEKYFFEKAKIIVNLAETAFHYKREIEDSAKVMGEFCIEMGWILDRATKDSGMCLYTEEKKGIKIVLDLAEKFLQNGEMYLEKADVSLEHKIKLYEEIQKFYLKDDFTAIYRCENYGNSDIVLYYQKIIDSLREKKDKGSNRLYLDTVSYSDCGDTAMLDGDYEKAIKYYHKAFDEGEVYDFILPRLSKAYKKIGKIENAIEIIEQVLEIDEEHDTYTPYVCSELVDLFISKNSVERARGYAKKLITYSQNKMEEDEDAYSISWILIAFFQLYKIETNLYQREIIWNDCLVYYKRYEKFNEVSDYLADFLELFANKMENIEERIKFALKMGEEYKVEFDKGCSLRFFQYAVKQSEGISEYVKYYVTALLHCAESLNEPFDELEKYKQALEYCYKAMEIYQKERLSDEYLRSHIYKMLGKCYEKLDNGYEKAMDEKRKCNYYLLAKNDGEGQSEEKQIELWKEAAEEYFYLEDYIAMERCYEELFIIWESDSYIYEEGKFDSYWFSLKDRVGRLTQLKENYKSFELLMKAYEKVIHYFCDVYKKEGKPQEKAYHFCVKLEEIAGYCTDAKYTKEAILLYVLSVIVLMDFRVKKDFLSNERLCSIQGRGLVISVFIRVIHEKVSTETVDKVLDILGKIDLLINQEKEMMPLKRELKWFVDTYQYSKIEFKR